MTVNNTTTKGKTMTNREANYAAGYRAGISGNAYNASLDIYTGYSDGWDHGHCDRPTLDELMPLDIGKERSTGCLD